MLQEKVRTFQQQGAGFVPLDTTTVPTPGQVSTIASDEEGFLLDNELEWEEDEDVEVPIEQVRLGLPSSFSMAERTKMGWVTSGELRWSFGKDRPMMLWRLFGLA